MILLPPPSFLFAFWDMEGAGSFIIHRYQYLCLLRDSHGPNTSVGFYFTY